MLYMSEGKVSDLVAVLEELVRRLDALEQDRRRLLCALDTLQDRLSALERRLAAEAP